MSAGCDVHAYYTDGVCVMCGHAMQVVEVEKLRAEVAKLRAAAPVMLTVMALLTDEADMAGLREIGLWYEREHADHIEVWLDAERARTGKERLK